MCRMLGLIPRRNLSDSADVLRSFRKLSVCGTVKPGSVAGHSDGWGIVTWQNGLPLYLGREPTDASNDPKFEEACIAIERSKISSPLIAHLRKASVGAKTQENTHPFVREEWAFAHNGTIRKLNLRKGTDSEWFFEQLLELSSGADGKIISAIATLVAQIQQVYRYSSLTFLLSNGKKLFAYRDYSDSDNYYTMYYTLLENAFVICQEKITNSDWQEIGNRELVVVDQTLNPTVARIDDLIEQTKTLPQVTVSRA